MVGKKIDFNVYQPWFKTDITYQFENFSSDLSQDVIKRAIFDAFREWADVSPLSYGEIEDDGDIKISWVAGEHGDGFRFDGKGGFFGHAFPPDDGRVHLDEDEQWTDDVPPSGTDLFTGAAHEIGHALGLDHSDDNTALMFPSVPDGRTKLQPDDIAGIQFLYGGWVFDVQTGTALHTTDNTFDFAMMGNDLVAIKKSNTGTNTTEVHILSGSSDYQEFTLQTGTALHTTDNTFDFAMMGNDLVAIKKSNTGTNTTEVHILSGSSDYQEFTLQTGTALHTTDNTFDFAMMGNDLVAIKKSNTGTNTTEVHILSGSSDYQEFTLQTGTALHTTDNTFDFAIADWEGKGIASDLVAIKKSNTGTNTTEVHILSGSSNYQEFIHQKGTALHTTDNTFDFAMMGNDLVAIKKSNTGTNTTEVHILRWSVKSPWFP